jgi:hypothetical protein
MAGMRFSGCEQDGARVAVAAGLTAGRADATVPGAVVDVLGQCVSSGSRICAEQGRELDEER